MNLKKLGKTDIQTAPIVFGGNVFDWTIDEEQSFKILDAFVEAGFNTIDTADVYSRWADGNEGGESEIIIGKWMKARGNRNQINIITKVGSDMGQGQIDISENYILSAVDKSLKRLQVEQIDLYLTHWDDDKTPVEETLGAYQKLIEAGKVRNIGASNLSPDRLQASLDASKNHGLPEYAVFQPEYNLFDREGYEKGVSDICVNNGLGVITYFSLASGFLTGKYLSEADLSKSQRGGGIKKYLTDRGFNILKALDTVANKHGISQAGVALAWLIAQDNVTAPIASATKAVHLQAFTEAANTNFDVEDLTLLNETSAY